MSFCALNLLLWTTLLNKIQQINNLNEKTRKGVGSNEFATGDLWGKKTSLILK